MSVVAIGVVRGVSSMSVWIGGMYDRIQWGGVGPILHRRFGRIDIVRMEMRTMMRR